MLPLDLRIVNMSARITTDLAHNTIYSLLGHEIENQV